METTVLSKYYDRFLDNPRYVLGLCIAVIIIVVAIVVAMVYIASNKNGDGSRYYALGMAICVILMALLLYLINRDAVNAAFRDVYRGSTKESAQWYHSGNQ